MFPTKGFAPISCGGIFVFKKVFIYMITCKLCGIKKEEEEFYLFNNNGIQHRRQRCKSCIKKREGNRYWIKKGVIIPDTQFVKRGRPVASNEEIEIPTGEVKQCNKCGETKSINDFYIMNKRNGRRQRRCKQCYNEASRPQIKDAWDNLDYRQKPGEWVSEEQQNLVHKILESCGWTFNRGKNLWYKIPKQKDIIYKDKDGVWHNLNTKRVVKNRNVGRKKMNLDMEEVMRLRDEGMSYKAIAIEMKTSYNTIKNKVYEYNYRK